MSLNESHGHIELIIGPMFAGKTTELMRRVRRELFAKRSCFVIKHSRDIRYNRENISSHDKLLLSATASVTELCDVGDAWRSYDVIAVDEGQFFPDVVDFCNTAADAGKTVIVSALDGDYRRQPFDGVCRLIPLAESVKKLSAVCMQCHRRAASFTYRTVLSEKRELIGGADMYIATCRMCYITKSKEKEEAANNSLYEKSGKYDDSPEMRKTENDEDITTPGKTNAARNELSSPLSAARKREVDTHENDEADDGRYGPKTRVECRS